MKYSPRTFENIQMSFFLHILFYIALISGVTRGLSQDGKGAHWPLYEAH